jgi:hypothetical protein
MAIADDFRIYPYSKCIRHTSGITVYTAVQFYSWIEDQIDEPGYMSYQEVIKFNTPTSFTMLNGWFIDDGNGSDALQYLTGGSIDSSGYGTVADPIRMLDMDGPTTDFVAGDKDKIITDDAVSVGPLLAYLNDYPSAGLARCWIRDTRAVPATILDNSVMATTGGTGAGTAFGNSVSGDEIYTNLFTLASFPTDVSPQVYVYQNHPQTGLPVRIAEWSGLTNWDRGTIDVLIPVKLGGSLINAGLVSAFVRETGDTFTFVDVDLSTGSRTPIATETAPDEVNVTKGEWYLLYDAEAGGGFAVDQIIQNVATGTGVAPSWYAEISAITDFGTEGVLTLRTLRGTILDNDPIFVSTTQRGVANGTPGDTYTTYNTQTGNFTIGLVVTGATSGAKRILRGQQDDGATGKLVLAVQHDHTVVSGVARKPYYRNFSTGEIIADSGTGSATNQASASTTIISGYSDVTVLHMNGTVVASAFAGAFTPGERVTWNAGASSAYLVATNGTTSISLGNVNGADEPDAADSFTGQLSGATADCDSGLTDDNTEPFAFTQQASFNYSVFVEGGSIYEAGRSLSDIYGYLQYYVADGQTGLFRTSPAGAAIVNVERERYVKAVTTYTAVKTAPFGNLAGASFFGAQGVWVSGMAASDANNVKLLDHDGVLHEPFASVIASVSNTRIGDWITVYLQEGTTGLPQKTTYTSHNTANVQSDSTFERDAVTFPIDTPSSGTFTVVDVSANEEHRYRYVSWATTILTLPTERAGVADAGSTGQTLQDDTATFVTWGIQRGDIIRNVTDSGWGYVVTITDETHIVTTQLTTAGRDWAPGDSYEMNSLVVTYNDQDKFFIPYIDVLEDVGTDGAPGSASVTLLFLQNRSVVIRVRDVRAAVKIQPFVTTSTITSGGMSVGTVRNQDTVFA